MTDNLDDLPEVYVNGEGQRIKAPTYELLMPCQIIFQSEETGLTGPTRLEAGEIVTTEATPNHQWAPLNRAAAERYSAWIASLPLDGKGFTQEEITEAAFAMRPREGEVEIPHEQWFPAVLRYAAAMKEKRSGMRVALPTPAHVQRRGAVMPTMPFAAAGPAVPLEVGRGPSRSEAGPQQPNAGRRARGAQQPAKSPMPQATASDAMPQTAGT
jgi:hypothetical protein